MAKLLLTQGYPDAQRGRSRHYYDTAKVYVYVGQCQGEYCYHLAGLTSWHFLRACFHAALSTLLSFLVSGDVRFQESAITSCHYLASCVSERRGHDGAAVAVANMSLAAKTVSASIVAVVWPSFRGPLLKFLRPASRMDWASATLLPMAYACQILLPSQRWPRGSL